MAASPPLLPPGVRFVSYGFFVVPYAGLSVSKCRHKAGVFVLPRTMAPASLSRRTAVASISAAFSFRRGTPQAVGMPAKSNASLIVTGTPISGW